MMGAFGAALWAEALKARRSKAPVLTALGAALAPLAGGFFMAVLKDPERARRAGLIGTKAQIAAGTADWPALFSLLGQAAAIGGYVLFALVATWVFGREAVDGTAKDLLALPTPREAVVGAKFGVVAVWCLALTAIIWGLGLAAGAAVGLPGWSPGLAVRASAELFVAGGLTAALVPPIAFVASASRGYLGPLGFAFLTVFLAQVVAAAGWGGFFPWSVPALFANAAGPRGEQVTLASYALVGLASLAGLAGTFAWWRVADHSR
jgi:ABC-2 type transport system permease protein